MTDAQRKALYEAQMRAYVRDANASLPAGWRIKATIQRSFPHRNRWRFDAIHDGASVAYWEAYPVVATLRVIVDWIALEAMIMGSAVVSTDAAGYVVSIEDAP